MTLETNKRLITVGLMLFSLVSLVLMTFFLYLDYPPYLRIINAVTVALYCAVGLLSHLLGRGEERVRVLVLFSLFTIGTFLAYPFPPAGRGVLQLAWAVLFAVIFFGTSALLFHIGMLVRDEPLGRRGRRTLVATYSLTSVLALVGAALYANGMFAWTDRFPATPAAAHHLVRTLILVAYACAGFGTVAVATRSALHSSVAVRRQALAVSMGVLPFALLRFAMLFLPGIADVPSFNGVEDFVLIVLPMGLFLAVNGFQLFGVDNYIRRSVLISLTLALLASSAYVMILTAQYLLGYPSRSPWWLAFACVAGAVALRLGVTHLSALVDTIFFPERIALRQITEGIVGRVAQHTDLRVVAASFTGGICNGLMLAWAALYVLNESGTAFDLAAQAGLPHTLPKRIAAVEALADQFGTEYDEQVMHVELGGHANALLRVGPKRSGEHLSKDELRQLRLAAVQVAAMIENARLFAIATRDTLTGLYRRAVFEERLAGERARLARYQTPFALVMLDLDHFKQVNDTHGHAAGDEVLRATGELLRATCREVDIAARYGGEEMVILLPNTALDGATKLAENLRSAIQDAIVVIGDKQLRVTASLGVAAAEAAADADDLLERADQCLYRAKRAGRNRVEVAAGARAAAN